MYAQVYCPRYYMENHQIDMERIEFLLIEKIIHTHNYKKLQPEGQKWKRKPKPA